VKFYTTVKDNIVNSNTSLADTVQLNAVIWACTYGVCFGNQ